MSFGGGRRKGKSRENVVEEWTKVQRTEVKKSKGKGRKSVTFCFNRDQDKCALTGSVFICALSLKVKTLNQTRPPFTY